MNWTAVVYGGPMAFVVIWWFVSARTWFKGPKVNVAHLMLGREASLNVVEGVRVESPTMTGEGSFKSGDERKPKAMGM
jgi:hypothetical protein